MPGMSARSLLLAAAALTLGGALQAQAPASAAGERPAYLDTALTFERRVADLVGRMTLEEKVSQMKDIAPGIERLGVHPYNWWNEGLHGVARSGLATVFPQAVGFAATWNDSLIFRMATVISDEARAKHHAYARKNSWARYQGLTIWSPNINIFRDPRWGRGQETYGEDPFLTGRLGVHFVRGLQGDDATYFKTVATVKHFAVHSGPEPERHVFDAVVNERDLRETYLPHFEMGIREARAYSLMCAYNRVNGDAACGSDPLLRDVLRGEWGFDGFVVSDCWAIDDIHLNHKLVRTAPEAAAVALKSGTDLDCGSRVYPTLVDAVRQGLVTEAQIDTSVKRLFLARMRLGMFDPPERVRWARTPYAILDQPSHKALALEVARESMVLLKNARNTLPLRKDLGTVAVIGPNADQWRMLLGNYNGIPSDPVTPLRGIREKIGAARVRYALGSDLADGVPVLATMPSTVLRTPDGRPGLRAEYFAGRTMTGAPVFTGADTTLEANWEERAPREGLGPDDFGVRWTAVFRPPATGEYRLGLIGTMKAELALDDSVIARSRYPQRDDEFPDPRLSRSEPLQLQAGREYRIRVDAQETYGDAQLQLVWSSPGEGLADEAMRVAREADAVVMVMGLTANLEGEEMPVQVPGFRGGDRTTLGLPAPQQRLLERVAALGKPTVLVLLNGSALAVNWAQESPNVGAIVEAWYPGQAGGTALADVLFGDYNPAGRLPVTFYRDTTDLPPFADYAMKGRTYRFFTGTPLYPFGHGLSYTSFRYANLRADRETVPAGDTVRVSVDVTNAGQVAGDEVVQLYVRYPASRVERPVRELRGYRRVRLEPGATRTVELALPTASLAYWDAAADRWVHEAQPIELEVGASSGDIRARRTIRLTAPR